MAEGHRPDTCGGPATPALRPRLFGAWHPRRWQQWRRRNGISRSESVTNTPDVLRTARQAWNAGDLDGYLAMYDDDIQLHGYTPEPMNKTEVRAFYEALFAAFADVGLDFHEELWAGDRVAIRFTMTGRHTGDFMGIPATHQEVELPGLTIIHFQQGKVIERWSLTDMLGLLVQLGAVPAQRGLPEATDRA